MFGFGLPALDRARMKASSRSRIASVADRLLELEHEAGPDRTR